MDNALVAVVTSLAEVWIETGNVMQYYVLPGVTSLAEVWIETRIAVPGLDSTGSHFPCGSVD